MMRESRQLWDEWEREAGLETDEQKIVKPGGIINFGSTKNRYLREVIEQFPDDPILTSAQIMEKYPVSYN